MSTEDRLRDALRPVILEEPPPYLVQRATAQLPARNSRQGFSVMAVRATAAVVLVVAVALVAVSALGLGGVPPQGPGASIHPSAFSASMTEAPTPDTGTVPATEAPNSAAPAESIDLPGSTVRTPSTPAVTLTDKERSDLYWNVVTHFGLYGSTYDSLAEITRDAHLIVRGRVIDVKAGQIHTFSGNSGPYETIFGIVAVDEVLKGVPQMRLEGTIEVARLGWPGMSKLDLPEHEVILFLKNYAQQREEEGVAPSEDSDDHYYYSRPNGYQCALRIIDGKVDVIVPPGLEEVFAVEFPGGLDDEPFEEIVGRIRGFVEASQ